MPTDGSLCLHTSRLVSGHRLEIWLIQSNRFTQTHGAEFHIYICDPTRVLKDENDDNIVYTVFRTTDYNEALDLFDMLINMNVLMKKAAEGAQ